MYGSDITYIFTAPIRNLIAPNPSDSSVRKIEAGELKILSDNPAYDLSEHLAHEVASGEKHCFGSFTKGTLSSYIFLGASEIAPKFNTAGVGFGGVGLRLPKDVFYVFKCYTLPEYRGANLAGLSIYNGAMALGKGDGWLITTTDVNNRASKRMFEKLGFKQRNILREYRLFNWGKYFIPREIELDTFGDGMQKRVELFTPNLK